MLRADDVLYNTLENEGQAPSLNMINNEASLQMQLNLI